MRGVTPTSYQSVLHARTTTVSRKEIKPGRVRKQILPYLSTACELDTGWWANHLYTHSYTWDRVVSPELKSSKIQSLKVYFWESLRMAWKVYSITRRLLPIKWGEIYDATTQEKEDHHVAQWGIISAYQIGLHGNTNCERSKGHKTERQCVRDTIISLAREARSCRG